MKNGKDQLRRKFLLLRKKNYKLKKKINFSLIFNLINNTFLNKKINIAAYFPTNYEANILSFINEAAKKNFNIVLPVVKPKNNMIFRLWKPTDPLTINRFGIPEPTKTNKKLTPDLILVPMVAFDKKLNRIGYGGGFYDRSLKKIKKIKNKSIALGIAYSFQQCGIIPINKNDFKLDYILTERGIVSLKESK